LAGGQSNTRKSTFRVEVRRECELFSGHETIKYENPRKSCFVAEPPVSNYPGMITATGSKTIR
jgi:hypothetical protein